MRLVIAAIVAVTCAASPALGDVPPARWTAGLATIPPTDSTAPPIAQFPGTVLVPADGDPFFASLTLASADLIPDPGSGNGYSIELSQSGTQGLPFVELEGSLGQPAYLVQTAVPVDCSQGVTYCAYDDFHDAGLYFPDDQPGSERFWGLTVGGYPAVADHRQCCNGENWSVAWYDSQFKQSFSLAIFYDGSTAPVVQQAFGVPTTALSPDDVAYANQLANVAAGLIDYQIPAPATASPVPAAVVPAPSGNSAQRSARPSPSSTCGAPNNPYGFTFCGGTRLYQPPRDVCNYFSCIASFWQSTNGYVVECHDGELSHSGGVRGSCSSHGGELRPLYQP